MDATEAQLRFGSVLSNVTNPAHPSHPLHASYVRGLRSAPLAAAEQIGRVEQHTLAAVDTNRRRTARMTAGSTAGAGSNDGHSARRDFLSYALSLMRSHNDEHADNLPTLDITSLKHVAYVLDALVYYMRSGGGSDVDSLHDATNDAASVQSWQDPDDNLNDETDDDVVNQSETVETDSLDGDSEVGGGLRSGRRHPFFQRSDSTIFLGCSPPDPFQVPLVEALPLADQPHLLNPYARKEELFGMPRQTVSAQSLVGLDTAAMPAGRASQSQWPFDHLPTHMALSYRSTGASSVVSQPTAVGDLFGMTSSAGPSQPPPAHVAPPTIADASSSSLAAESSVIVQPLTSSAVVPSRPSYSPGPAPAYLGVASAPAPIGTASSVSTVKASSAQDSSDSLSVDSIPLPDRSRSLPPVVSSAYSVPPDLSSQPLYLPSHQQHSVIVHPSTSSTHLVYHAEPLELSVNSRGGETTTGNQPSCLRSPPAYEDLHASNNVCLDLTNPYRSAAVEIPSTVTRARTAASETTS